MIFLFSVALFIVSILYSQTFDYTHWSGGKYRATIMTAGGGQIQFYHTHLSNTGWIHVSTSANIDYKTDDGRDYTATLRYEAGTGRFIFLHCPKGGDPGDCHEDVIIRVLDGNNGQWEISIKPQSGEDFGKKSVTLEKRVLREPDQEPPPPPPPTPPTPPQKPQVKDNPLLYIKNDIQTHDRSRSIICQDHYYMNTNSTKTITLVVQYQGSTFDSDCSQNQKGVVTKTLRPGDKVLFFSNIGGNPDIVSGTFTQ
jgi:hypothetical protein